MRNNAPQHSHKNALNFKPEPEKSDGVKPTPIAPKYTLYAFEVRAANGAGAVGFERTIVTEAEQDSLKEMIRQKSNCMDSSVEIIPPADWSPPAIASVSMPAMQQAFPAVINKVLNYFKRCGIINLNEQQLISTGNVIPNPISGRILFVYRLEGLHAQPQPAMKPSLAAKLSDKVGTPKSIKKWWEFWKK